MSIYIFFSRAPFKMGVDGAVSAFMIYDVYL